MQRRQLLTYLWATAVASVSSRVWGNTRPAANDPVGLLKSVYAPSGAARRVGPHCCASQQSLEHLIELAGIDQAATSAEIVSDYEQQRQLDFENGETVLVNGWVLARAEASMIAILGQI